MKAAEGILISILLAAGILLVWSGITVAAVEPAARVIPVTLTAGETYVIPNLGTGNTPAVHVIDNPQALIMRTDPKGAIVLLGAEAGEWAFDVTDAANQPVTYKVKVNAIVSGGAAPPADVTAPIDRSVTADSANKMSVTSALDAGAGPIAATSSSDPTFIASPTLVRPTSTIARLHPDELVPPAPRPDPTTSSHVISSQGAAMPPPEKFHSDPPAAPSAPIASSSGANYLPADMVTLMAGTSRVFDFAHRLRRVSVADTEVADLQVVNPYQLNLIAHKEGFTTLAVWDNQGRYEQREVRVDPFGKQQVMLNCIVAELNRDRMESQAINWTAAISNVSLSGLGPGGASTPYSANSMLSANPPTGILPAGGQIIPLLLSQSLNYGLAWGDSVGQAQAFFNFLETHSLAKILAEPHLLANSGEKAEFLSGGEIPIVIAQALNTSIEFKQFGTSVIFIPTVVGDGEIEMAVKPEVSQPDYVHGVQEFGFNIPAFVTRRADTFVRIKNNQTLIIAGLLLHTKSSEVDKTPYLGDLPYVGSLFRRTVYNDSNTDLVMSVTPQIVQGLPANGVVATPIDRGQLNDEEIRTDRLAQPDASRPRF